LHWAAVSHFGGDGSGDGLYVNPKTINKAPTNTTLPIPIRSQLNGGGSPIGATASTNAMHESNLSNGLLASAFRIALLAAGGSSGVSLTGGTGSSCVCLTSTEIGDVFGRD